ncbi:hypothetical protein [Flavobacterium sp. NKUCC04_CG]|uniref:hypothetical protein n=1 Tax=Flavobacterium sp. NKUCC04_CG TaxID=2842121 RepID=UPI001C5BCB3C|nr:hypothetical protein [Flavobacterium sp. NKUCC04_CG]MBW3518931.1 hypothetical protein [Flavobacterium sp. NKUCC04_CG]
MKKLVRNAFGILFLSSLFLVSCSSSDDNNPTPPDDKNAFVLNENNFNGKISKGTVTLDASKTYILNGRILVEDGASLVIPAGTKIIGTGGTTSFIAVAQGGKIFVNGTAEKPVVMTANIQEQAQWGGLVICGKAPINKGKTATAEVSELTYGGDLANDSSGSITYLRVEYAGARFNTEKEFNGISFFGVGNGTKVEYVQAYKGADDGFEFFGGTVNTKYLVSNGNEDDQFDWTEGWVGTNSNWYAKLEFGRGNRGIEADNNATNRAATPIANPTINNITLIGLGEQGAEPQGLKLREGTKANIDNLFLSNFTVGFDVEHDETLANVANGSLKITNVKFDKIATKAKGKNTAKESVNVDGVYTENANATGAEKGADVPTWAKGWTIGL